LQAETKENKKVPTSTHVLIDTVKTLLTVNFPWETLKLMHVL